MRVENRSLHIAHVVTLFSPDGAFGGPVRVAVNQAKALAERGHRVKLFGAARGFDIIPTEIDGVPAELFPATNIIPGSGFAGLFSAGLARHLTRVGSSFDVIHVHLARDLVTLPAAWIARNKGVPYVTQPHGMIDRSSKLLARPLDLLLTKPLLRDAARVLYLTGDEASDIGQLCVGQKLRLEELPNGVPVQERHDQGQGKAEMDVLFLARLHEIKRPRAFVEAAQLLFERFPEVTFSIVGPDEGEEQALHEMISRIDPAGRRIRLEGSLSPDKTAERMRRSAIYVLPSKRESFGMTVLEAMREGLPVVLTETTGLAPAVRAANAGIVVDGSPLALSDAIGRLLADEALRATCGKNGRELVEKSFSIGAITTRLEEIYLSLGIQWGAAAPVQPSTRY